MINKELFPKAYKEVIEILKHIPKEDYEKIPKEIIENMEKEKDKQYEYNIANFDDFNNQPMLKETETILSVLYRDYWATQEQRERIRAKERYDIQILEEEKSKKYNPEDIFKNKKSVQNNTENANLPVEVKKQNFFTKLVLYIKKFLKIDH